MLKLKDLGILFNKPHKMGCEIHRGDHIMYPCDCGADDVNRAVEEFSETDIEPFLKEKGFIKVDKKNAKYAVGKKMTEIQKRILERCCEINSSWNLNKISLENIIKISDTQGDGFKRVVVGNKRYLVPIEDIICYGINGAEVPEKYKEEE